MAIQCAINIRATQKLGNAPDEMEDVIGGPWGVVSEGSAVSVELSADNPIAIAVADGATTSSFAREWAELLVERFIDEPVSSRRAFLGLIDRARAPWWQMVYSKNLPWFALDKARTGAYSTLLGFTIKPFASIRRGHGSWSAIAVGDTCMVQERSGCLVSAQPLEGTQEFGLRPTLISSHRDANRNLSQYISAFNGKWLPGDKFYLMTDAFAYWVFQGLETGSGQSVWTELHLLLAHDDASWQRWADEQRSSGAIHNDDLSIVQISLEERDESATITKRVR